MSISKPIVGNYSNVALLGSCVLVTYQNVFVLSNPLPNDSLKFEPYSYLKIFSVDLKRWLKEIEAFVKGKSVQNSLIAIRELCSYKCSTEGLELIITCLENDRVVFVLSLPQTDACVLLKIMPDVFLSGFCLIDSVQLILTEVFDSFIDCLDKQTSKEGANYISKMPKKEILRFIREAQQKYDLNVSSVNILNIFERMRSVFVYMFKLKNDY